MKKILIITLLMLIFSCKQKVGDIELISTAEDNYHFIEKYNNKQGELASSVYKISDIQAQKISKTIEGVKKILQPEIDKYDFDKIPNGIRYRPSSFMYTLYIDEKGKINKVVSLSSQKKDLDNFIVKEMNNWQMEIFYVNNKPQKYVINWEFNLFKPKNKEYLTLLNSSLRIAESIGKTNGNIVMLEEYFISVEEMPEPIGGVKAIQEKIIYPEIAKRAGIEGRVYVKAFIDENGNVTATEIIKGLDGGCSEMAADAVKNTKFEPGRQKGKPVKVQVTIPILFKLSDNEVDYVSNYVKSEIFYKNELNTIIKHFNDKSDDSMDEKWLENELIKLYGRSLEKLKKMKR